MSDELIPCADCRIDFTFSESEAAFFASKGLTKPRRCKACRQKRRDAKAGDSGPGPTLVQAPRSTTKWVGGGEAEPVRPGKDKRRERRRDRGSDDHSF